MTSKIALFAFLLLLTFSFVSAEIDVITYATSSSFSVFGGSESISLCQCDSYVDTFVVTNIGMYASKYQLANTLSDMVRLSDGVFELLPGESKTVYVYVEAPCSGVFSKDVLIEVSDIFGHQSIIEKTISVSECQNLEVSVYSDISSPISPCTPITYSVDITNVGAFTETYDVVFGDEEVSKFFSAPALSIMIPTGQKASVSSTLELSCDLYGNFSVPFSVTSRQSNRLATLEHSLVVNKNYTFTAFISDETLCSLDTTLIPFILKNDADFNNSFSLDFSSPAFITLDGNVSSVSLASGEEKTLFFRAMPLRDDVGSAPFSITVTSLLGGVVTTINKTFPVETCHQVKVAILSEEDIVACSEYAEVPIIVTNEGKVSESVNLSAQGAYSWVNSPSFTLSPGESFESKLIMDVPSNVSFEGQIVVRGLLESGVEASDSIRVSLKSKYECSRVNLLTPVVKAKYGDLSAQVTFVHDGLREGNFSVSFLGDNWLGFNASEMFLRPGERVSSPLLLYQVEKGFTNEEYLGTLEVLSDNGQLYSLPLIVKMSQKNIFVRAYNYFSVNVCQLFSALFLIAIIVLAFILLGGDGSFVHNNKAAVAFLVVWAIVALAAFASYGLPSALQEPLPTFDDPLEFALYQGDSLVIDASMYFVDPDNNSLTFLVDDVVENVSVAGEGSVFTLTPSEDFVGSRRFRIVANDGDEDTRSPRMYLHVVETKQYGLWDLYVKYCVSANVFLFLVLVLLAYFVFIRKKKKSKMDSKKEAVVSKEAVNSKASLDALDTKKSATKRRVVKRKKK